MGKKSLVALDTDHIKQYVFATDRLQEIRGASSILDTLNRRAMVETAEQEFKSETVYANGGSGLFLIKGDSAFAEAFGQRVQQAYHEKTDGGASITYAIQELPDGMDAWHDDTRLERELLRYKLVQNKSSSSPIVTLPSHPFLRPCSACGIRYAEYLDPAEKNDTASQDNRYCGVCWHKRLEDDNIKSGIDSIVEKSESKGVVKPYSWERVIGGLANGYHIPEKTERPPDFNELRGITGGKAYLALIYADGNSMGQLLDDLVTLTLVRDTAKAIDNAVFAAMSAAVSEHLKVVPGDGNTPPRFPFDMLLMGGDDAMIVTPAPQALDVACTLAEKFHEKTQGYGPEKKGCTLSTGVILAPVKYPFGLLQDLSESTLKYAKKEGAKRRSASKYGDTFINFMTVTGSTSLDFNKVYKSLHDKHVRVSGHRGDVAFYATLRPYTVEELTVLLDKIREGKREALGRTKLHQVREAVLQMNLTSSVRDGIAVLRNWRTRQREFVMQHVYTLGGRYQEQYHDAEKPGTMFPRVTFPWFADGSDIYRTSLLDFVELYDFVAQEEVDDAK